MAAFHDVVAADGFHVWVEYNPNNLKVNSVNWDNQGQSAVGWRVWAEDGSFEDTGTIQPGASGSQNVSGNVRLRERVDPDFGVYLALPEGVALRIWEIA